MIKKRLLWLLVVSGLIGVSNFLVVDYFTKERDRLEREINSLYFLSVINYRQIETLQNLELRRTNPDLQQRLKLIRQEYGAEPLVEE